MVAGLAQRVGKGLHRPVNIGLAMVGTIAAIIRLRRLDSLPAIRLGT